MSGGIDSRWYVLRTKVRGEDLAATNLRRLDDVEVYFPKLAIGALRHLAAGAGHIEALFPGYLFARLDLARRFYQVSWTPGVRNFLSFGDGAPEALDDAVVELLRLRAQGGDVLHPRVDLQRGTQVEVRSGPFAGLLGIIERPISGAGRVAVLLEILKRQTRVELSMDAVARLT